jgi:predicted nucleic acid-binding protein
MIVLDTNVISEAMKSSPAVQVLAWLDRQVEDTLWITSITFAEIHFGIENLPEGRRRKALREAFSAVRNLFCDRTLSFDADAAVHFGRLAAGAKRAGRPLAFADGCIAAIATSKRFDVASRDGAPFSAGGLYVIDPWKTEA